MPDISQNTSNLKPRDREFVFEQYMKLLTLFMLDHDVLHDFEGESETVENVTSEKIRGVFSQGYRFAMMQVLQNSKKLYQNTDGLTDGVEELVILKKLIKDQYLFINERIDDSFMLNSIESREGMTLSETLKRNFDHFTKNNFLRW